MKKKKKKKKLTKRQYLDRWRSGVEKYYLKKLPK